ncbi:hypothetical protein I4F81_007891 [Pyropia yezoensis]|uniref:Uncharacterized protein n=1 Tax=Pyropia yezoensis TaxID=2788 RepID=A0ACC3C5Z7_PYRYE|nr:hypothetical protein I4F81_007891 [Neopyropia yezoensis]
MDGSCSAARTVAFGAFPPAGAAATGRDVATPARVTRVRFPPLGAGVAAAAGRQVSRSAARRGSAGAVGGAPRWAHLPLPPPRRAPLPLTAALATGFGLSAADDTPTAVADGVAAARRGLPAGSPPPALALVSATAHRDLDVVAAALDAALPGVPVHGLSSCGALLTPGGGVPAAVGVLLLAPRVGASAAPATIVTAAAADADHGGDAGAAAAAAGAALTAAAGGTRLASILFAATPGGEEAALAALAAEHPGVPISGGSAADNDVAGEWRLLVGGGATLAAGTAVVGFLVGGAVAASGALVMPYDPAGVSGVVTSAAGRRVETIDGAPAARVVAGWMGGALDAAAATGGSVLAEMSVRPLGVTPAAVDGGATDGDRRPTVSVHAAELGPPPDGGVSLFKAVTAGDTLSVLSPWGGSPTAAASAAITAAWADAAAGLPAGHRDPAGALLLFCGGMAMAVGADGLDAALRGALATAAGGVPTLGVTVFGETGVVGGQPGGGGGGYATHANLAIGVVLFG